MELIRTMESGLNENKDDAMAKEYREFLATFQTHDESDVVLVCLHNPASQTRRAERFYCHRHKLATRCQMFASMQSFETCAATAMTTEVAVPASGDVVLEVLRYVYTGVLLFPPIYYKRFSELLVTIDFLGICYGAEHSLDYMFQQRHWETSPRSFGGIFDAVALQGLLASMSDDMLQQACHDTMIEHSTKRVDMPSLGITRVGFITRQALWAKVFELRLRASGGPPPSDPFVTFDNFLKKTGIVKESDTDEDDVRIDEDRSAPRRRHSF
eukprot:TRINITY_DN7758_c0_g1_i3.p1 TRINITY_DN7758_c0_g1~~TRINITY_DN7758_c0_g1_i3.p1  ORF type:complete len:270 (+),score=28.38 TRINITY_DN7758_c0_g1_i3:19-828(+)